MAASSTKATSHIISNLHLGADADGVDLKVYGDTTGNFWMYDASENRLVISGTGATFHIGAHSSTTVGSATALSEAGPSAVVRFYGDDGGVAIGTATGSVPDVKNLLVRTLITVDNSAFDMRLHSIMGQLKGVNAEWGNEQVSAVHGYLELTRSAGTITLQAYGVTAGLMATVETAGDFGVAVTHNLAGVAAISKLGYTGTFTDNTNTSGLYVGIYDSTNWSDSPTLDKWNHGVYIQAASVDKGIQIGELSSSTQTGLTLVAATGTSGLDVFTDDGNTAITGGTPFKGIRSRTMFFKDMITGTTVMGVLGQLKYASGVDVGPARVAAVEGYNELMTTNIVKSGGTLDCVRAEMEGSAGTFTVNSGGLAAGFHANMTGAATFTQDSGGLLAGLKIGTTASTGKWGFGIYVTGSDKAFYNTTTQTGAAALNNMELVTTDATTQSSGYSRTIYANHTNSGTKTGSAEVNVISADFDASANVTTAYCFTGYTGALTGATINRVAGYAMYITAIAGTVGASSCAHLETNGGATTNDFISMRRHAGTIHAMISDRSGGSTASFLLHFNGANDPVSVDAGTPGANSTHKIACQIGGTTAYIALYADY